MSFKLFLLFLSCNLLTAQSVPSSYQIVVPEFCREVVTSTPNQQFVAAEEDSRPPRVLVVAGNDNLQACFERDGIRKGDSSWCQSRTCVCVYDENEWEFYGCDSCSIQDMRLVVGPCLFYSSHFRWTDDRDNDSGSHALLAWFFIVMIALALSCCCRCLHNQLCCGCCSDSRNSNRERNGIELEAIRGERPSAAPENSDSSTSSKPPDGIPTDQIVVIYNPDVEEINIGVKNAT